MWFKTMFGPGFSSNYGMSLIYVGPSLSLHAFCRPSEMDPRQAQLIFYHANLMWIN